MTTTLAYTSAKLAAMSADEPLVFKASTETLNRNGYQLRLDRWRLDSFNANPVFLWMHDSWSMPIGRGGAVVQDDHLQLGPVEFDAADPFAVQVESKYRRGFLTAVSVGWHGQDVDGKPLDMWRLSNEDIFGGDVYYDLAEVSGVTVPGDPKAVRKQQRLALRQLGRELVELFDEKDDPAGEITSDQLQAAVAAELERLGIAVPHLNVPPEAPAEGVDKDHAAALVAAFDLKGLTR